MTDGSRHEPPAAFCLFFGYGGSGHSLVGSLIDAHPDAVIAHEYDAVRAFREGMERERLFSELIENSRRQAAGGRRQSGYSYALPGQWQGRWRRLRVLGDKRGGVTTVQLGEQPERIGAFRRYIGRPLKPILVVRNPFDIVASMVQRNRWGYGVASRVEAFELLTRYNATILAHFRTNAALIVRLEDIVYEPARTLSRLLTYLELEQHPEYIDDCATMVWRQPERRREEVEWDAASLRRVNALIEAHPFLAGYAGDGA